MNNTTALTLRDEPSNLQLGLGTTYTGEEITRSTSVEHIVSLNYKLIARIIADATSDLERTGLEDAQDKLVKVEWLIRLTREFISKEMNSLEVHEDVDGQSWLYNLLALLTAQHRRNMINQLLSQFKIKRKLEQLKAHRKAIAHAEQTFNTNVETQIARQLSTTDNNFQKYRTELLEIEALLSQLKPLAEDGGMFEKVRTAKFEAIKLMPSFPTEFKGTNGSVSNAEAVIAILNARDRDIRLKITAIVAPIRQTMYRQL